MNERSVRMDLLDQQIVDADGRPVGRVDDVVLEPWGANDTFVATAVLTGMQALGERLGGTTGALAARTARRLREDEGPSRIGIEEIEATGSLVRLRVPLRDLPQVAGLERWLAERFIGRLPGTGDARD
jgi:sporulation protein YlmC with PRC-barrel domain